MLTGLCMFSLSWFIQRVPFSSKSIVLAKGKLELIVLYSLSTFTFPLVSAVATKLKWLYKDEAHAHIHSLSLSPSLSDANFRLLSVSHPSHIHSWILSVARPASIQSKHLEKKKQSRLPRWSWIFSYKSKSEKCVLFQQQVANERWCSG